MQDQAHIFTPLDSSLTARVKAYQSVYAANIRAEASLGVPKDDLLMETLGSATEISDAAKITQYSMKIASDAFQQEEIQVISQKGLLNRPELDTLKKLKIQQEFESVSQNKSQSDSQGQKI